MEFQDSGHPWMFPLTSGYFEHEKYLRSIAEYRRAHPSPMPNLQFGGDDEHKKSMEGYRDTVKRRNEQLLEQYGK